MKLGRKSAWFWNGYGTKPNGCKFERTKNEDHGKGERVEKRNREMDLCYNGREPGDRGGGGYGDAAKLDEMVAFG